MKKIYLQKTHDDNALSALKNLLTQSGIRVSDSTLEKLKYNPSYPSLACLSDSLSDWNVENMAVNLSIDQLKEVPFPSIIHLHKNNGHFVVLTKSTDNAIEFIDPEIGWVKETIGEFTEKWTGAALLISPTDKSGEPNYHKKKLAEKISVLRSVAVIAILLVLASVAVIQKSDLNTISYYVAGLVVLKVSGLCLSILLVQTQFSLDGQLAQSICNVGKNFSCVGVLNSSASKIFGVGMSELGLVYFIAGLFSMIISSLLISPGFALLSALTFLTLPYTLFSILYQWRIAKSWCPLCIGVMFIFWLEMVAFISGDLSLFTTSVTTSEAKVTLVSFLISILGWLVVRPLLDNSSKFRTAEKSLARLKRSTKIFNAVLQSEPIVIPSDMEVGITLGNREANYSILMVTNPICGPCAMSHQLLNAVLKAFPEELKIQLVFMSNPGDRNALSTLVSKQLIDLSISRTKEYFEQALDAWYAQADKSNTNWIEESVDGTGDTDIATEILTRHYNWCKNVGITSTPTFFINGRKLPAEYSFHDLIYHLTNILRNDLGPAQHITQVMH